MTRKRKSGFGLDDSYINSSMKDWDVPGLSIAVVKDGKTVLSRGYGVRSTDNRPVDQNTLFTIGSCTKAFTATAIAILAMEKKLSWDDPVCKFLPDFALLDPQVTAKLTLRDMASHQSGVEDGKVSGIPASSTDEAIQLLASIKATQPFRGEFAYNNTMFAVLGRVVEKVSGMSWETFLTSRILSPLGMNNSFATSQAAAAELNTALPFHADNGFAEQMNVKNLDFLASSAGMQSNVADLTKWLNFQLGIKRGAKTALLSRTLLDEMHSEQLALTPNP
ncbi:MAG: beta-lactamase family protein, partial [Candidatus Obscuribacterales bacterium]|nr:beta-lactamase family protein [Candidatus Obscuribacterales bacterium]